MTLETERYFLLTLIVALPLAGALLNGFVLDWIGRILGRAAHRALTGRPVVHGVAISAVAGSFLVAAYSILFHLLPHAREIVQAAHGGPGDAIPHYGVVLWKWIRVGGVDIDAKLLLDPLSAVMILVVTGVSSLIHVYSTGYMSHDPAYRRFFTYLNLFVFFMSTLVLGDNLAILFVGWEGVGLCSYLLIGFWYEDRAKALAGKKAFITNRIGDFGFLLGLFVIGSATGHLDFQGIRANLGALTGAPGVDVLGIANVSLVTLACLLLFLGATGKSAQLPLFVWLPDAMAGPTPVSALIHAATMVTAGVYMVARLDFLFLASPPAMTVVAFVGAFTAIAAALIGFAQNDIKKVLAYSTISQLGYMFVAVGVGAFSSGIFHLMTHAFFKACLFLGAGSVIHGMHERQDIREMGDLRRRMPHTHWTFAVSVAAISGVPLLSGFFSKDEIIWRAFANPNAYLPWAPRFIWAFSLVTAAMTAFYMTRLYLMVFWGRFRGPAELKEQVHESPRSMTVPLMALAVLAAIGGYVGLPALAPNYFEHWLSSVVTEIPAGAHPAALEWGLMGLGVLAAAIGIVSAWPLYSQGLNPVLGRITGSAPWLYRWVHGKLWVDETYGLLLIRPLGWMAALCHRIFDRFLIDKVLVEGTAWIAFSGGWILRKLQGGSVQRHAGAMALGLAVILYAVASPRTDVTVEDTGGGSVRFTAPFHYAPYTYSWDFDGDSLGRKGEEAWKSFEQVWTESTVVEHRYPGPGVYKAVLRVRTPWHFERERVVEVRIGRPGKEG